MRAPRRSERGGHPPASDSAPIQSSARISSGLTSVSDARLRVVSRTVATVRDDSAPFQEALAPRVTLRARALPDSAASATPATRAPPTTRTTRTTGEARASRERDDLVHSEKILRPISQ